MYNGVDDFEAHTSAVMNCSTRNIPKGIVLESPVNRLSLCALWNVGTCLGIILGYELAV